MTGPIHAVIGAAAALPVAALTREPVIPCAVAGAIIARLPDWDLRLGIPHRGPTHSFAAGAVVSGAVGLGIHALLPAGTLAAVGVTLAAWLSHLAADLANPSPMALLWPFRRRRLRPHWLPAVVQASLAGRAVELVTVLALVFLVVRLVGLPTWAAMRAELPFMGPGAWLGGAW
ncbi:MAG: metal-dependent hydrolase [Candidatus Dormibacteraeota bacterium]|nr:metal-dependent hydrolase [Candidatus Dormibacteraeota bacterium]